MPRQNTRQATDTQTNATATAAIAAPGISHVNAVAWLHASVGAGSAQLTVTTDTGGTNVVLFRATVTPGGPINLNFDALGPKGLAGKDVTATLTAAGATNVGTVGIGTYLEG